MSRRRGRGPAALHLVGRGTAAKIAIASGACLLGLLCVVGLLAAAAPGATGTGSECMAVPGSETSVPANYVPWLEAASNRYRLGPRGFSIVAAVHYVESDFGRS